MTQTFNSTILRFLSITLVSLTAFSCSDQTTLTPTGPKGARMLPDYIDYNPTGGLSNYKYRSRFVYDNANRLLAISDTMLYQSASGHQTNEWVRFRYTNNVLTTIDIPGIIAFPTDPGPSTYFKDAHFDLTYTNQTLDARLLLDGLEAQKVSFNLDQAGFPVKTNTNLGELIFDGQGNIDYKAIEEKRKQNNSQYNVVVLTQQYDTNKNVFADSKEVQIMAALLAATNRNDPNDAINLPSELLGLGNPLTTNNLLYRKKRQCSPQYGCSDREEPIIDAQTINEAQFPIKRLCSVAAFGQYQYTIQYKLVN